MNVQAQFPLQLVRPEDGSISLHAGAPDMQLVRISLLNWYAYSKTDIEVVGNVTFIGPNGAGKSSVIDAINLVLNGANKNRFTANASADRMAGAKTNDTRRSVFDYCVGTVDNRILREESITGLALVFRSISTGKSYSVGSAASPRRGANMACRWA